MIFKFGKDKLSDFVKVIQFMEKEGIDFEGTGDLGFSIGKNNSTEITEGTTEPVRPPDTRLAPPDAPPPMHNLGWEAWSHDGAMCNDVDCKDLSHFGVHPI